jgi:glycosyltransferase involved in cell wall biosynthesis
MKYLSFYANPPHFADIAISKNGNLGMIGKLQRKTSRNGYEKILQSEINNGKIMSKISIFIPVFNAEKYLKECLNSVKNQTFPDWECLIVDDGSTDNSRQIIDEFTNSDTRFKAFFFEHCENPQRLKEFARSKANGAWFFDLDADDFLDIDCLNTLVNRQKQTNADTVILQTVVVNEDASQTLKKIPKDNFDFDQIIFGKDAGMLTINEWQISTWGLVSKNLYNTTNIDVSDDSLNLDEYVSQATLFASKTVAFSKIAYFYRQHQQQRTKKPRLKRFAILHSDKLREKLVISYFGEDSKEALKAKNTFIQRWLSLYVYFFQVKKHFSNDEQHRIKTLFSEHFKTLSAKDIWNSDLHVFKKCVLTLPIRVVSWIACVYASLKRIAFR